MDVLSDLLHRARAGNAAVRRLIQRPPWSMTYADPPPLTVITALGGPVAVTAGDRAPGALTAGDIAIVTGTDPHTVADSPGTPPRYVVRGGRKYPAGSDRPVPERPALAPRTYGDGDPAATTMLRGAYDIRGGAGARLLAMLPPLAIVPAGARTRPVLELLAAEAAHDEPGQDAVLARLLDLVLVIALRAWCAGPDASPPGWYTALADPAVGTALALLHAEPARRWTVAELAAAARLSRAAFAARFTRQVGEPPLAYLTGWRLTLAADRLRATDDPVAAVARDVGYGDAFAFSVAFKRAHGTTPSAWRRVAES
ncbi:AraC family transcriptional regulator [Dactylosporangium matsuzakiense]|uniref:AraC family transcriptional regulator n=1 Tax=Dactylosporangium matsuzakiense TaxID=53360 RepID=A0A9W6KN19_9ACTN|nr:AraC family transcriptional regulator [Dactylosporangium matsuzakiense]UWZ48057.1 AraC family transcriptional regulator [Dactylosporangium matsuzakiense]GLL03544.1 AraC family transcriptional regulator [Dactylosporangium matsuzakiense]